MFCEECGTEIMPGMKACPSCAAAVTSPAPSPSPQIGNLLKVRCQDAFCALKIVAANPVGGLPVAFQSTEKRRAMEVGIVFAVVFEICAVIGLDLALPRWGGGPSFADVLKLLILGLVPFAAIAGACTLARRVLATGGGGTESDIFIAGTAVLPFGVVLLITGIVGFSNFGVIAIAAAFANAYSILILFAGCTRISGISEQHAAPAVPVILLITAWISKILFGAMF